MRLSTVLSIAGVLVFAGGAVLYGYLSDRAAAEPFDASVYMDRAWAGARAITQDAQIASLRASMVDELGRVHPAEGGHFTVYFRSPSKGPTGQPTVLGAPPAAGSMQCPRIRFEAGFRPGVRMRQFYEETAWFDQFGCETSLPGVTQSTLRAIWERAVADGAPRPAYAEIDLDTDKTRHWTFRIVDQTSALHRTVFEHRYADDSR
jgi:hypothetical protein